MKVAEILSDLVSLQACDHSAAMNLVSPRSSQPNSSTAIKESSSPQDQLSFTRPSTATKPDLSRSLSGLASEETGVSPDLQRALDLVDLHYGVKERHVREGGNEGLAQARRDVEKAV